MDRLAIGADLIGLVRETENPVHTTVEGAHLLMVGLDLHPAQVFLPDGGVFGFQMVKVPIVAVAFEVEQCLPEADERGSHSHLRLLLVERQVDGDPLTADGKALLLFVLAHILDEGACGVHQTVLEFVDDVSLEPADIRCLQRVAGGGNKEPVAVRVVFVFVLPLHRQNGEKAVKILAKGHTKAGPVCGGGQFIVAEASFEVIVHIMGRKSSRLGIDS